MANGEQKHDLYSPGGGLSLLFKQSAYQWRKCVWFMTTVRPDDNPYRCLSCRSVVRVGQEVIGRRSAHEQTQGCYGPIECFIHWSCYVNLKLTQPENEDIPELGPKHARMERYGSEYRFAPRW